MVGHIIRICKFYEIRQLKDLYILYTTSMNSRSSQMDNWHMFEIEHF